MRRWIWIVFLLACEGENDSACSEQSPGCGVVSVVEVESVELAQACQSTEGLRVDVVLGGTDGQALTPAILDSVMKPVPTADDFVWGATVLGPVGESPQRPLPTASVNTAFTGPAEERLTVLVLDQSASLVGLDPDDGNTDRAKASDPEGKRIGFFTDLLTRLPATDRAALVWFNGLFGQVDPDYATPTTDRQALLVGLQRLEGEELGGTPLARGLIDALEKVIEPAGVDATVILFTDGVEGGDTSDLPDRPDPSDLEAAVTAYARAQVPVVVVHLAPPEAAEHPRDRDPALADLACRSGGSYLWIDAIDGLTPALRDTILRRLPGVWRTRLDATVPDPPDGGWLLDARLTVFGTPGGGQVWLPKP